MERLRQICAAFDCGGAALSFEEIQVGHVNRSYKVFLDSGDVCVLQAVNDFVFKRPEQVMENIDRVTAHLRAKNPGGTTLNFFRTADGRNYLRAEDGFWRLCGFIPSDTHDSCEDPELMRSAGQAFGEFQCMLADFDAAQLHDTIPDFHNTRKRYETLLLSEAADPCGKVREVRAELDWLKSVQDTACSMTDMHQRGELPLRVTHNDTKINNVLFEPGGCRTIAVIDLDTVMPGLVGHDFGDAIRYAANYAAEDCPEPERAGLNMAVFAAFADGFLSRTAASLTQREIDTLALGAFVIAAEQSVRFLDDYILGSPYYKTAYPEHNLVRARCQIALAKDMLARMEEMEDCVRVCAAKYK